jgi:hypothetical protein
LDGEAGEEHDRLAGDRDAGRLQRHQEKHGHDAGRTDEIGGDVDDRFGMRRYRALPIAPGARK